MRDVDFKGESRDHFKWFNRSGTGHISAQDIIDSFKDMGQELTLDEAQEMIKIVDQDGDGLLNLDEFTRYELGILKPLY
jgi:Ca2+-binding EF-hand superfamily protein